MTGTAPSTPGSPTARHTPKSERPWRELEPYSGSPESQREHAEAIRTMLQGRERLWLGPFKRPDVMGGPTRTTHCPPAPCAGCTCAKATDAVADPNPDDIALVLPTSGSTGTPKAVAHSVTTLKASIHATAHTLGAHGAWFLLLPPTHIAGIQVIARACVTSTLLGLNDHNGLPGALAPLADLRTHFNGQVLLAQMRAWEERCEADASLATLPLFTSLVPTQLERVVAEVEAGNAELGKAVTRFTAILIGGAACPPELLERARAIGARITTTYGSSETAGGCVYNGTPIQGVEVAINDDDRLMLASPSIALGYVDETGTFANVDGNDPVQRRQFFRIPELATTRLFVTSDLAQLGADPSGATRVQILGRADDVIISGGRKIVPQQIESVLDAVPDFAQVLVVPVKDQEWGQMPVALITPAVTGQAPTQAWKADLATQLTMTTALAQASVERHMIPRVVLTVGKIPTLASGKVDRAAAARLATTTLQDIEAYEYARDLVTRHSSGTHTDIELGGPDPRPTTTA